jgi:molybdopterin-containing oxidoreductase family membrane subunit
MLVLMFAFDQDDRPIGDAMMTKLKGLMGIFIGSVLFFVLVYFLTKLYGAKNYDLVSFYLVSGGVYTLVFWLGWMLIGLLIPLGIFFHPVLGADKSWVASACGLVVVGGLASMYVIIIGGQAYPMQLFPGKTILASGFYDGVGGAIASYSPSLPEILLGFGGVAVAMLITAVGIRMLQFLPESLDDKAVDPHAAAQA